MCIIGVLQHAWYTCIYCVYTCVYTAYILRISSACFRTWCVCVYISTIGLFCTCWICSIYCVYTCVYTTHIIAYRAHVTNMVYVYMWHVYRLFYNMLDMLDILHIYMRIYCVYSAHIWRMSPNIGITWLVYIDRVFCTCLIYLIYYVYICIYTTYILRISGTCFEHILTTYITATHPSTHQHTWRTRCSTARIAFLCVCCCRACRLRCAYRWYVNPTLLPPY